MSETQMTAAVVTTFADCHWDIYAKKFLQTFAQNWPAEIPLLVALDDNLLYDQVIKMVRPQDAVACGWEKDHADFVARNKDKDHQSDYRKQAVRFCHKVFAIKRAADAIKKQKELKEGIPPRYLIWLDADVLTSRPVSVRDIQACLPKEGDAVAYLGRKDWEHSECGWLAFDLENGGDEIINRWVEYYTSGAVFAHDQWHDSWLFDQIRPLQKSTNLTADKPGMDIWPHSPMAAWSRHFKGPQAKQELIGMPNRVPGTGNIRIITKNSLPDEKIQDNIRQNQAQIKNWVNQCAESKEEIVLCSAGPMLIAEDLREEVAAGRKIIAVKHALLPLKEAGVKPWACILLDPRDHVGNFVDNPDKDIIWFVASQVEPTAIKKLLDAGCEVWGYHAAVGAGELDLIKQQEASIVGGGSATATRGIYMLDLLGFRKFRLYGYDLCLGDKPNLDEKDAMGQPKYLEFSIDVSFSDGAKTKRAYWSEPQYIAQYEEMTQIIQNPKWKFQAFGFGIAPFIIRMKNVSDLRQHEKRIKLIGKKLVSYQKMMNKRGDNWFSQTIRRSRALLHPSNLPASIKRASWALWRRLPQQPRQKPPLAGNSYRT